MKEEEIRPANIFDEYLRLAKQDTETYFRDAITTPCDCPACGKRGVFAFLKHGFAYDNCPACHSLFVSPRPAAIAFSKYYTESPSSTYWATTFYKETAAARKEKLWRPKARLVLDLLEHFNAADYCHVTHQLTDKDV